VLVGPGPAGGGCRTLSLTVYAGAWSSLAADKVERREWWRVAEWVFGGVGVDWCVAVVRLLLGEVG